MWWVKALVFSLMNIVNINMPSFTADVSIPLISFCHEAFGYLGFSRTKNSYGSGSPRLKIFQDFIGSASSNWVAVSEFTMYNYVGLACLERSQ
jgi:hypothetical protein